MTLIKCEECGKEISSKAESCPNCGFPRKPANVAVQPKKHGILFWIAFTVVGFIVTIIIVVFWGEHTIRTERQQQPFSQPPTVANRQGESPRSTITQGSEARLFVNGLEYITVAVDKQALDDLLNASIAKDDYGLEELILTGRVFRVLNNTKVIVLDRTIMRARVRILEGHNTGITGWVPYEWVR